MNRAKRWAMGVFLAATIVTGPALVGAPTASARNCQPQLHSLYWSQELFNEALATRSLSKLREARLRLGYILGTTNNSKTLTWARRLDGALINGMWDGYVASIIEGRLIRGYC